MRTWLALSPFALLVPSPWAAAGTIQVPDLGAGITTLQQGLDAAADGDTVLIAPGTYRGRFTASGKNALTIRGKGSGKVILEARDSSTLAAVGPALDIDDCNQITIQSLVIQHALATGGESGAGIEITQSQGVTLDDVVVIGCEEEGIVVGGDSASLRDVEVSACAGGIKITGNNATISDATVHNDSVRGIVIFGDGGSVLDSRISAIRNGSAISLQGETPTVVRCTVTGVFDATFSGITSTGSSPTIEDNTLRACPTAIDVVYGGFGVVGGNLVEDCFDIGIRVGDVSHHITLKNNVVRRCATGFWLHGGSNTVKANRAEDCASDGFDIQGPAAELENNLALRCGTDGFDIALDAVGAILEKNEARECRGEGFENSAQNVTLKKNVAKRNRIDFANDGTVTTSSGNSFTVGGAAAPEID
jgi:Right handed beta helix region